MHQEARDSALCLCWQLPFWGVEKTRSTRDSGLRLGFFLVWYRSGAGHLCSLTSRRPAHRYRRTAAQAHGPAAPPLGRAPRPRPARARGSARVPAIPDRARQREAPPYRTVWARDLKYNSRKHFQRDLGHATAGYTTDIPERFKRKAFFLKEIFLKLQRLGSCAI